MSGYDEIKQLAKERRCRIRDLLALAPKNDPFFVGSPMPRAKAEWFADLWERFGYTSGVHLRRVHYRLVNGERQPTKHDGMPYENTEHCWDYLQDAGKAARYLGLVRADAFVDRRNHAPHLYAGGAMLDREPGLSVYTPEWTLPSIETQLAAWMDLSLPGVHVSGYDYQSSDQPYHVEVWVEKSTQDDVLLPVCRALDLNLVTSLGYQSITSAVELLQRIAATGKPARILYISDFDPAGDNMPTAVARQLEFWLEEYAPGADVKLTQLALTGAQVEAYQLPRIPVKDSDTRKAGFEERNGEGAAELDALEAIHPGTLARLVREAVAPYRDLELADRLRATREEVQEAADDAWAEVTGPYLQELASLDGEVRNIVRRYQGELERLSGAMAIDLEPLRERLETVRHAVQSSADALGQFVDLPDRPEPEVTDADEGDWLFDAGRDYLAQLEAYKARKVA